MKFMKSIILTIAFAFAALTAMAQTSNKIEYIFHDVDPVPVNMKSIVDKIDYPEEAIANKIEGTVVFRVFVNEKGEYRKHYVFSSAHPALAVYADNQIENLEFEPALADGEPVAAWVNIPVKFEIRP